MANGSNLQHTFLIHPLIGVLNFQYFLASFFTKKILISKSTLQFMKGMNEIEYLHNTRDVLNVL